MVNMAKLALAGSETRIQWIGGSTHGILLDGDDTDGRLTVLRSSFRAGAAAPVHPDEGWEVDMTRAIVTARAGGIVAGMCRNIRTLHNFEPPATSGEVYAAALQYVRKIAGTSKPSAANAAAFEQAVAAVAHITEHLLDDLVTTAPPKDREVEAAKARARAEKRYG